MKVGSERYDADPLLTFARSAPVPSSWTRWRPRCPWRCSRGQHCARSEIEENQSLQKIAFWFILRITRKNKFLLLKNFFYLRNATFCASSAYYSPLVSACSGAWPDATSVPLAPPSGHGPPSAAAQSSSGFQIVQS